MLFALNVFFKWIYIHDTWRKQFENSRQYFCNYSYINFFLLNTAILCRFILLAL